MRNTVFCLLIAMMILVPVIAGSRNGICLAAEDPLDPSDAKEMTPPVPSNGDSESVSAPVNLKIGSYNIKNGCTVGYDYTVLASDILAAGLDVCGLQEVDQNTFRNGRRNTMKLLSEATGYPYYAFSKAIDFSGGEYGTGILSKYPIVGFEAVPLNSGNYEQRSYGHAVILVNGMPVDFYNTHLCYQNARQRSRQLVALAQELKGKTRWVLTGDFNASFFSEYAFFEDSQIINNEENPMNTNRFRKAADNIVLPSAATVMASGCYYQFAHSDHYMIWADVVLP